MEEDRESRCLNNGGMTRERVRWLLEEHARQVPGETSARAALTEVCFTSGEPTTRDELPEFASLARELGYARISVMTNGRRLSYLPYAVSLVRHGVRRFYVSVHGHDARLHDALTRTPGSFAQTVAGLVNLASLKPHGVEVHSSTVLTTRNLPHLGSIYRFLRARGVDQVVLNVMQPHGRADQHFDAIFPPYTVIAAAFRAFLAATGEARAAAFLVDIPLCATEGIPDFNRGYVERYRHYELAPAIPFPAAGDPRSSGGGAAARLLPVLRSDLDRTERLKRADCSGCRYDAVCEGVWRNYLRRHGWEGLAPVPA